MLRVLFWKLFEKTIKFPLFLFLLPNTASTDNLSAIKEVDFVCEAILDLLKMNCIEELSEVPNIVNPLSVSIQSSGKKRLILDLRHVNLFVYKQKFKCEDLRVALSIISRGFSLFKFDLKSGYHHVEIFPEHRKFLAFSWGFDAGIIRYFQFAVHPFGLSSAPYLFTKLFRPLVKMWRCHGILIVVFLDDGLGEGATRVNCQNSQLEGAYRLN